MAEHVLGKDGVKGSIPFSSFDKFKFEIVTSSPAGRQEFSSPALSEAQTYGAEANISLMAELISTNV